MTPNSPRRRRTKLAVAIALLASLALPAAAAAQSGGTSPGRGAALAPAARPEVGIEDEALIFGPNAPGLVARWRSLGVDSVRVQAYWDAIAPNGSSPVFPAGFNPADPNDPQYHWAQLDRAINLVVQNGMRVNLTINQCNPRWASTQPAVNVHCWRPNPQLFAQFAVAAVKRYRGRIRRVLDGSEPNQAPFLAPQFSCNPRCIPDSPHQYRNLVNASYPALKAAAPEIPVVIGEVAPIGSPPSRTGGLKPLTFLRAMGCVDTKFRPIRTGACAGFKPVVGDLMGIHPYVNNRRNPLTPTRDKDLAKIGDLERMLLTFDSLSKRGRVKPRSGRRFQVLFTEYGYISNPPSGKFGVSLTKQAVYNAQSAFIVWQHRSRIKLLSQYLYMDDPTFGTGLVQRSGRPKPSLAAFPHPFWIDGTLKRALFWGQVRPDASRTVTLQVRKRGRATFSKVRNLQTDAGGYWHVSMRALKGALYRFQYSPIGAPVAYSIALPAPTRAAPSPRKKSQLGK